MSEANYGVVTFVTSLYWNLENYYDWCQGVRATEYLEEYYDFAKDYMNRHQIDTRFLTEAYKESVDAHRRINAVSERDWESHDNQFDGYMRARSPWYQQKRTEADLAFLEALRDATRMMVDYEGIETINACLDTPIDVYGDEYHGPNSLFLNSGIGKGLNYSVIISFPQGGDDENGKLNEKTAKDLITDAWEKAVELSGEEYLLNVWTIYPENLGCPKGGEAGFLAKGYTENIPEVEEIAKALMKSIDQTACTIEYESEDELYGYGRTSDDTRRYLYSTTYVANEGEDIIRIPAMNCASFSIKVPADQISRQEFGERLQETITEVGNQEGKYFVTGILYEDYSESLHQDVLVYSGSQNPSLCVDAEAYAESVKEVIQKATQGINIVEERFSEVQPLVLDLDDRKFSQTYENKIDTIASDEDYESIFNEYKQAGSFFGFVSGYLRAHAGEGADTDGMDFITKDMLTEAVKKACIAYPCFEGFVAKDDDYEIHIVDNSKQNYSHFVAKVGSITVIDAAKDVNCESQNIFFFCNEIQSRHEELNNKQQTVDNGNKLRR